MTLNNLKNEYAIKQGFANWNELLRFCDDRYLNHYIDSVMKIYAMECLKLASDNAWNGYVVTGMQEVADDVKKSITNENNIIK